MLEFFYGWRRTAGGVSLMLACLLLAGWMRSLKVFDAVYSDRAGCSIRSYEGRIEFCWWELSTGSTLVDWYSGDLDGDGLTSPYYRDLDEPRGRYDPLEFRQVSWRWDWGDFHASAVNAGTQHFRIVPYWSFVLPLTLLSTYLILSKRMAPRQDGPPHK